MKDNYDYNPDHLIGTCGKCGTDMVSNVPRLGSGGGFVHKETGRSSCNAPDFNAPSFGVLLDNLIKNSRDK